MNKIPKNPVTALAAWALAFGCALGWDAAVLPWTEFLPKAGPLGTVLGILVGGLIMSVIAWNYSYMMRRMPGPGGAYAYVTEVLGPDRGFLCGWFLCFAYVSIIWLDATVLSYFAQHAFGLNLRFGFHYVVAGYEVSLGNIAVSAAALAVASAVCFRRRLAPAVQTALSLAMALCVLAVFCAALLRHTGGVAALAPAFAPGKGSPVGQTLAVFLFSPWLFIGFETVSHVSGEFAFPVGKSFRIMVLAIFAVVVAYALYSLVPALVPSMATGMGSWPEAVASVAPEASNDVPFITIARCFGPAGRAVIAVLFVSAVFTNLVGNTVAASRLLAAMADDGPLPAWFGRRRDGGGAPRNAVAAIAGLSVFVFLLGETVIGVVVEIALMGAALAYAYTSVATFVTARRDGDRLSLCTGMAGAVVSAAILVLVALPVFSSHFITMSPESLLVITCWCIAGLLTFLSVFRRDRRYRFGRSPVVWVVFSAMIVVMSVLWTRQATRETTEKSFAEISALQDQLLPSRPGAPGARARRQLRKELDARQRELSESIMRNGRVQTSLAVATLVLMVFILRVIARREREMEAEKTRAKSYFFSTVSHDIRTPLNAIIGFSQMLKVGGQTEQERVQALDSILVSGKTLLGLVNDVLDLSKLESGKMEIRPEPVDAAALVHSVMDAFLVAGSQRGVELRSAAAGPMPALMLDPQRLRQMAFNLVSNAVKYTTRGHVEARVSFAPAPGGGGAGVFRLDVEDTGCGISPEDLERLGAAYVQVGDSKARNGGTGLGLAICRQLASAMGGRLEAKSQVGRGSVFSIVIPGVRPAPAGAAAPAAPPPGAAQAGATLRKLHRILLVDDTHLNLMVLKAMLASAGRFEVEMAGDGAEALARLRDRSRPPFDLVLSDMWMPKLDGGGLVAAVRADPALSGLRVVAVTADSELVGKAAALGFDDTLLKPLTAETLSRVLREAAAAIGDNGQ